MLDGAGIEPARSASSASAWAAGSRSSWPPSATLGAAVSFYGGGIVTGRFAAVPAAGRPSAATLQTPWLGLFGDQDEGIPVDDVEQLRDGAARRRRSTPRSCATPTPTTASTATHAASYHEASAKDAWARTLAWFEQHLA